MSDKQFVGSGWEKTFQNGGKVINISINKADIAKLPEDERGNVRLVVGENRKKDKSTHYVAVDDYRYSGGKRQNAPPPPASSDEKPPF